MKRKITNILRRKLIRLLRKAANSNSAPIWDSVADYLERSSRRLVEVNISKINRYTEPGDVVVVPGKVLGAGTLDHEVTVAAFAFTQKAYAKIKSTGGRAILIEDLVRENPRGSGVKIIV